VVESEVRLHGAQLVVFERRAQALLSPAAVAVRAVLEARVSAAVTQHVQVAADDITEAHVACSHMPTTVKHTLYQSQRNTAGNRHRYWFLD